MWPGTARTTPGGIRTWRRATRRSRSHSRSGSTAASGRDRHPQEYYDEIKAQLRRGARPAPRATARRARRSTRPTSTGELRRTTQLDPYAEEPSQREPINDHVEVLFIGGGFSALLTVGPAARARRREHPHRRARRRRRRHLVLEPLPGRRLRRRRLRLPAAARRDGLRARPSHYAEGPEIFAHCQAIARRYDLYELAVFQTTVTSTVWDDEAQLLARHAPIAATA